MRESSSPRFSFAVRLACACFGGPLAFLLWVAKGGRDDPFFIWGSLLVIWAVSTAWVLAGKAHEVNGWGELKISEVIIIPLLTLTLVVGTFFMLVVASFAGMH